VKTSLNKRKITQPICDKAPCHDDTCGGGDNALHALLTSALDGGDISFTLQPL